MQRRTAALVLVALATSACIKGVGPIRKRSLPHPNPTSYTFPLPLKEFRAQAIAAFSIERQVRDPVFGRIFAAPSSPLSPAILHVSVAGEGAFGSEIFRVPLNHDDIYLQAFHQPLWPSPVYRGWRDALPFLAEFHVQLSPLDSGSTRVTVTALRCQVVNGMAYGIGSSGPGWANRYRDVKPTTIEEYMIIRYLGAFLGTKGMPEIAVPTA